MDELGIKAQDVDDEIPFGASFVKVGHHRGKLFGWEIGCSSSGVQGGGAKVDGVSAIFDCCTELWPSACWCEDLGFLSVASCSGCIGGGGRF